MHIINYWSKEEYVIKANAKLGNLEATPKASSSIISRFLSTKKISIIAPILVNGKLIGKSDF